MPAGASSFRPPARRLGRGWTFTLDDISLVGGEPWPWYAPETDRTSTEPPLSRSSSRAGHIISAYRASAPAGTAAVQLAKHDGARATAVCEAGNAELGASLGADAVIDYKRQNVTEVDERYDVIFVAVGNRSDRRRAGAAAASAAERTGPNALPIGSAPPTATFAVRLAAVPGVT